MDFGKCTNGVLACRCQGQPNHPPVVAVSVPLHEAEGLDSARKLDHAVVTHEQVLGDHADRRATGIAVTFHRKQQLVLNMSEANCGGLFLAPPIEPSQRGAESQQRSEVRL
jgi:hypothetical protein